MYDRMVDVPRLTCFFGENQPLPHPALDQALAALNDRYAAELGEPLRTAGLCLYRDGRDSVAWHGDYQGRGRREDTLVAIVSLGSPRPLLLRPRRMSEHRSERQRARSGAHDSDERSREEQSDMSEHRSERQRARSGAAMTAMSARAKSRVT